MSKHKINPMQVAISIAIFVIALILIKVVSFPGKQYNAENADTTATSLKELFAEEKVWTAPDVSSIPKNEEGRLILYGRELIVHTSKYFGPNGSLAKSTNGLNCQSCHLDAGTRPYGNNLGAAASTYPRYSPRAGNDVSLAGKVNECFSRSMNGTPIDTNGKEMKAYLAYINWLGKDFHKEAKLAGSEGIKAPHFINRAADPIKGKEVYEQMCARCHGHDGQGQLAADVLKDPSKQQGGNATADDHYYYPPVWGKNSFNGVATLYRLSKFAGFVKNNMPYPMDYRSAVLTDEQAWDVAAYVNTQERSFKDHSKDYLTDIAKKPYDFPFPPYADNFSEEQHKFGPYKSMPSAQKGH
jgi:thiosulfate dehydrogenase